MKVQNVKKINGTHQPHYLYFQDQHPLALLPRHLKATNRSVRKTGNQVWLADVSARLPVARMPKSFVSSSQIDRLIGFKVLLARGYESTFQLKIGIMRQLIMLHVENTNE